MSDEQKEASDLPLPPTEAPDAKPQPPVVDDELTVVHQALVPDPEATIIKPDPLLGVPGNQDSAGSASETSGRGEQSTGGGITTGTGAFATTGGSSGTSASSRSSSWGQPEMWQADDGRRLEIGSVIKDRFELIELLGEGGMGRVFKAVDRRKIEAQDRHPFLAIKILNDQFKRHPESLKALQREARKAQDLAHPNIVTVFDFDREGSTVFMTMEYLDGQSLKDIIKANPNGLPVPQALTFIQGMCHGLAYAHAKGIVHSDFKPGNVFVTRFGVIKIFDFGIARAAKKKMLGDTDGDKTTFDAANLGALTPAYASPEMFQGEEPDPRDDIFALACISYELFSGRHPYNKERADQAHEKGIHPKRLEQLHRLQWKGLHHGLLFDRDHRTADALHFLREISRQKSKAPLRIGVAALAVTVTLLVFSRQIKSGWNQYQLYTAKNKINGLIETERDETLTKEFIRLKQSQPLFATLFLKNDVKPLIISTYSKRSKKYINHELKKYNFPKALALLNEAITFYQGDAEAIDELQKVMDEYRTEQYKLIAELRDRFEKLISEGKILPVRGEENVFNVMDSVALIDPNDPLLSDTRLVDAYIREADRALASAELERASDFIKTGLEVAENNQQLQELNYALTVRLRAQEQQRKIDDIEQSLAGRLKPTLTVSELAAVQGQLKNLKDLQPDHPLLAKAGKLSLAALDRELKPLVDAGNWQGGTELLGNFAALDLVAKDVLQSRFEQVNGLKTKMERAIDMQVDRADWLISNGKIDEAATALRDLQPKLAGDVRIQRLVAKLLQSSIQRARAAKDNQQWETARSLLDKALTQAPDEGARQDLLREKEELRLAEAGYRQLVQQAETEQIAQMEAERENKRQAELSGLYEQFNTELKAFQPSEQYVYKTLAILDAIGIKNAGDPFVAQGRKQLETLFLQTGKSQQTAGLYDKSMAALLVGAKAFPESTAIADAIKEQQQKREMAKLQERANKIAGLLAESHRLIDNAQLTKEWEVQISKVVRELTALSPEGQQQTIDEINKRIIDLYVVQAQKYRSEQQFIKAGEMLDRGGRFGKDNAAIAKERQLVSEEERVFKEKAAEQQQLAEIEGLKQSFRTYAQANEVDRARTLLNRITSKVPTDDAFLAKEAPQFLAATYLRLAERKAGNKDNRDALLAAIDLTKTGLSVHGQSPALQQALTTYTEALAKLEKQAPPPAKTETERPTTQTTQPPTELPAQTAQQPVQTPSTSPTTTPSTQPSTPTTQAPSTTTPPPATAGQGKPCLPGLAGFGTSPRAVCYDMLGQDVKGPYCVVIPAGGKYTTPFAIGKFEVAVRDYALYSKATGKPMPKGSQDPNLPVVGISTQDAQGYAKWLSAQTGNTYRLPKDGEWVYAAEAGGKKPVTDFNCYLQQGGTVLKGSSLQSVSSGTANGWGLQNAIGNAQELVDAGGAFKVRGGSFRDSMSACSPALVKDAPGGADEQTGFRLVREIKEQ